MAELADPFEREEGGSTDAGGPPVISWNGVRVGTKFKGILVPPNPFEDKGYRLAQSWTRPSDDSGERPKPAYWPPDDHDSRRPVSLKEYKALAAQYGETKEPQPVSRAEFFVLSGLNDFSLMSEEAEARLKEAGATEDEGLRRVLHDGADLRGKIDAALAEVKSKPVAGMTIEITISGREPNKNKEGKTNRFDVVFALPTPETKQRVAEYVARAKAAATAAESAKMEQQDPPF